MSHVYFYFTPLFRHRLTAETAGELDVSIFTCCNYLSYNNVTYNNKGCIFLKNYFSKNFF